MDITVTDAIDEHTLDAIRQGLRAYNLPHIDASHRTPLSVYARDEAGTVIGGLTAETWGNWLSVEWLWVADSQRGSGLGGRLMRAAEREAQARAAATLAWIPSASRRGRSTKTRLSAANDAERLSGGT